MNKILFFILFLTSLVSAQNVFAQELLQDELVEQLDKEKLQKPVAYTNYNFEDTKRIPILLSVIADIESEKELKEGQTVVFRALYDVWHKGHKVVEKNEIVHAKVETIITSGMNGIPASIIFGDFQFNNIDEGTVTDTYETFGQDRSLWVYPLKWALTFLPPTGSLTNFIKGGHAKLKSDKVIELYYYPNWKD